MNNLVILVECPDRKGLVAEITRVLFDQDLNIVSNWEFVAPESGTFFMRTEVEGGSDASALESCLSESIPHGGSLRVVELKPKDIVILATKEAHCLGDLLVRCRYEKMNANIKAVVSNHEVLRELVESFGIPFHFIPHQDLEREAHEDLVLETIKRYSPEFLVLAKYMRILTPKFVAAYPRRIINIHHSFLPAFIGANPYRQAYERGVKIIGATAHFVSDNLDEGPIIAQQTNAISHQHSPKDLARTGRDAEKVVLARALRLVLDERVFVCGNKTIIFD